MPCLIRFWSKLRVIVCVQNLKVERCRFGREAEYLETAAEKLHEAQLDLEYREAETRRTRREQVRERV